MAEPGLVRSSPRTVSSRPGEGKSKVGSWSVFVIRSRIIRDSRQYENIILDWLWLWLWLWLGVSPPSEHVISRCRTH